MASTFPLELVTPERLLFSEEVEAIRAPGVTGSFGILANHAPLLTELATGLIKLTLLNGSEAIIATSGGFLEVSHNKVTILADSAQLSDEIDVEKAKAAAERARKLLELPDDGSLEALPHLIDHVATLAERIEAAIRASLLQELEVFPALRFGIGQRIAHRRDDIGLLRRRRRGLRGLGA